MISDELKNQIKDSCEIENVIQQYVPSLKRAGSNFKGLCPFHKEKTPSFHVFPDTQHFYCFGCQKGGDIYTFIMEHEGLDFPGAMKLLGQQIGIDVEARMAEERGAMGCAPPPRSDGIRKEDLYQLHEKLATWYEQLLLSEHGRSAYTYWRDRGFSDELMKAFRIGYAPNSFDAVKDWGRQQGYSFEQMLAGGVLTQKDENDPPSRCYDRWRDRLMFPIGNPQGRVIGFSGRVLNPDQGGGKYVNSPETPIFHKSAVLYGLHQARNGIKERGYALLCEGQVDTIACHAAGITNAIAPQGTAFTEQQAKLIKRYTDDVVLCFDSDNAGINAALKSIEPLMAAELNTRVVMLDHGEDPDSIVQKFGTEALLNRVDAAVDFFQFLLDIEAQRNDNSPSGKSRIVRAFLEVVAKLKSPVIRAEYCQFVAQRLGLQIQPVFQELNAITNRARRDQTYQDRRQARNEAPPPFEIEPEEEDVPAALVEAEAQLIDICLYHEKYANQLEAELDHQFISKQPTGQVLNDLLAFTAQGEWDMCRELFGEALSKYSCPQLIKALNDPEYGVDADPRKTKRCFEDCYSRIMLDRLGHKLEENTRAQRNADSPEQRRELLKEWQELSKKRKQYESMARSLG